MNEYTVIGLFCLMLVGLVLASPWINSFRMEAMRENSIPRKVLAVEPGCKITTDRGTEMFLYCVMKDDYDRMQAQAEACLRNPVTRVLGICGGNQVAYIRAWEIQPGKCYNLNWVEVPCVP